jgi:hypothetical protein
VLVWCATPAQDNDFSSSLSTDELQELCADIIQRALEPCKKVLLLRCRRRRRRPSAQRAQTRQPKAQAAAARRGGCGCGLVWGC